MTIRLTLDALNVLCRLPLMVYGPQFHHAKKPALTTADERLLEDLSLRLRERRSAPEKRRLAEPRKSRPERESYVTVTLSAVEVRFYLKWLQACLDDDAAGPSELELFVAERGNVEKCRDVLEAALARNA